MKKIIHLILLLSMVLFLCSCDTIDKALPSICMLSFGAFILIAIVCIAYNVSNQMEENRKHQAAQKAAKEKQKQQQKAHEEAQKKAAEEEARRQNTRCVICKQCSMGTTICQNCWQRSAVIKKELPLTKHSNYRETVHYHRFLMKNILDTETRFEAEMECIRLLAVADILNEKYFDASSFRQTHDFLIDLAEKQFTTDELIKKYELSKITDFSKNQETQEQTDPQTDFRQRHPKKYRCADGDYVRSKAEQMIDDFFYQHKIWHIYEQQYIIPGTNRNYFPDFYLPDYNLYIEYFGKENAEYLEKKDEKIKVYTADPKINFEYLTYKDDVNITERITAICKKYNIPLQ